MYGSSQCAVFFLLILIDVCQSFHHKLTKRELVQTFGVNHVDHVPDYHLIRTKRRVLSDQKRELRFNAWDHEYVVELQPNDKLVSPQIKSVIRDYNSTEEYRGLPIERPRNCHYIGHLVSHNHQKAAISDCRKLMGVIVTEEHFLMLQTIPDRLRHEHPEAHLVYKRESGLLNPLEHLPAGVIEDSVRVELQTDERADGAEEGGGFCDVTTDNSLHVNYTIPSEAKLDSLFIFPQLDPITLEIALFLDSQLFEHFKREFTADPVEHLTDFALALINNVHVLYQQPSLSPNLDIVIVHFELWKTQPPPLATHLHKNGQAQTLLDSFCRHQARINPGSDLTDPNHWDHGVLLTGYDIYHTTPSVAGVAPVARMCDELFACSLVEGLHLGRSFVLAHEMGHNMGMVHDGVQNQCNRSCCLMSAVNGAGKTTWSSCSVREFNAFMLQLDESGHGNCLRDPAVSISTHDHLNDGRLPGQRFTADQQCAYFWGRDFQVEIPNGRSFDDICRILWCGNSASSVISTAHPWCQEGQCEEWKQGTTPPARIDGNWSMWSSGEKPCPVNQCQVTGSIAVNAQLRTCTNPAPNNAGKPCVGSNIRGLVCGGTTNKAECIGLSRKEYGDRLCTSIRNDPIRPDQQLSGISFLHVTQPCKVWCLVSGSELIRNKGQFPNGSPCGDGHYCVGGSCLRLDCDDKAVVSNSLDCPADLLKKETAFDEWTSWTECSVSCGRSGIQKRWRKCLGKETQCEGKTSEIRDCSPDLPPCPRFSSWTEWTSCECVKGHGLRRRTRVCLTESCDEPVDEDEACEQVGRAARRRCANQLHNGKNGNRSRNAHKAAVKAKKHGKEAARLKANVKVKRRKSLRAKKRCNEKANEWQEWRPCSVSCGIGFQIREKICENGKTCKKEARTCNVADCSKEPEIWSSWTQCSKTCGQGLSMRHRRCIDSGTCARDESNIQERKCFLSPCSNSVEPSALAAVNLVLSSWQEWQPFGSCSASCGSGYKQRFRTCRLGHDCSSDGLSFEIQACSVAPCPGETKTLDRRKRWSEWSSWSICSLPCDGGRQTRQRTCESPLVFLCEGYSREERGCNPQACDLSTTEVKLPEWSAFSEFSACSCFTLRQFRRRYCIIRDPTVQGYCIGNMIDSRPCEPESCLAVSGGWTSWSSWSDCSQKCGGQGHQIRNRMCANPFPSNRGTYCLGYSFDQRVCTPKKPCIGSVPINGGWSEWTPFSNCSDLCNGQRSRSRYCTNPNPQHGGKQCVGNDFELQSCSETCIGSTAGKWSNFTEWTNCSSQCGFSFKSRHRLCNAPKPENGGRSCNGLAHMTSVCRTSLCPNSTDGLLTQWSNWTECESVNCGRGMRTRTRSCIPPTNGGAPCFGRTTQIQPCTVDSNSTTVEICSRAPDNTRVLDDLYSRLT
ncbi:hypothetical protein M3Y96_00229400 [Aphelenchoides besseyi]|nr:hypothetical protein M3Y96_00229400 [Aphelenchoides besseyi]